MLLEGTVTGGVVVLDEGRTLPEGTRVEVVVKPAAKPVTTLGSLLELAGTVDDLPADMARNHDHYLHGAPKR